MRAIVLLVLCGLAPAAAGEVRVLEYRAVVGGVASPFESIASLGDPAYGRITFDTDAIDVDPDPAVGRYPGATHELAIGTYAGRSTQSVVQILDDDSLPPFDAFQVVDPSPGDELAAIGGLPLAGVVLAIYASSDLYAGDALPALPPSLDDARVFDAFVSLSVLLPGSEEPAPLFADLHTLPEPADAASAALLGLLVLAAVQETFTVSSRPPSKGRVLVTKPRAGSFT